MATGSKQRNRDDVLSIFLTTAGKKHSYHDLKYLLLRMAPVINMIIISRIKLRKIFRVYRHKQI